MGATHLHLGNEYQLRKLEDNFIKSERRQTQQHSPFMQNNAQNRRTENMQLDNLWKKGRFKVERNTVEITCGSDLRED